jgi:hypothetical protein
MNVLEENEIRLQPKLLGGGKKIFLTQVPEIFTNLQMMFEQGAVIQSFPFNGIARQGHYLSVANSTVMRSPGLLNAGSVAANLSDLPMVTDRLVDGLLLLEQWDAVDGAVFRYFCAYSESSHNKYVLVGAKVIATGSGEQQRWLHHTFGNKALVPFMNRFS